ncbi:hypothetical protein C8R48DRAFT_432626 [Suillus tomentosus]|nr:hypothetical protein C8R48DRAFT_432626 [Suillus tomentosus]
MPSDSKPRFSPLLPPHPLASRIHSCQRHILTSDIMPVASETRIDLHIRPSRTTRYPCCPDG